MTDSAANFVLTVNGQVFGGWKEIELTRSLDVMAPAFEITCTDRWPGQPQQWPLQTGQAVKITESGELLVTGWIDEIEPRVQAEDHTVKVRGRGRTCDLVDCSAMNKPGTWKGLTGDQIIAAICKPFGIGVTCTAPIGAAFPSFALQQGEACKDAIDRICQQRCWLPIETPTGDLLLAAPSANTAAGQLMLGGPTGNIEIGEAKQSALERFSVYVVKGNRKGSNHDSGAVVSAVTAQATDAAVTRYRPLMILSEDQATTGSAKTRAQFAATVRAGRGQTGKLTVSGARDAAGKLWAPNYLIPVAAGDLGLISNLLINETKTKVSDAGTQTEIHVVRPEAYSLGEIKGASLSRLDNRAAGRGRKGKSGRKGKGPGLSALADLQAGQGSEGEGQ